MSDVTLTVDYLELNVGYESLDVLLEAMPGELTMLDVGWKGYRKSALINGGPGRVCFTPGRGCHVSLPSKSLRQFARLGEGFAGPAAFISTVQDGWGGRVDRIDLAWDDRKGMLDLDVIKGALENGAYTSRWRGGFELKGWGIQEGSQCVYLGSRKSDAQLKVYNKAAEKGVSGHWVRVELTARRERADALAAIYKRRCVDPDGVTKQLAGVLLGYIAFRERTGHGNRSRWPVAPWWSGFLGSAERASLGQGKADRTVEDVQRWIASQVAPSLAVLVEAMGSDEAWAWLHDAVEAARQRLGPRHRAIIAVHAQPGGRVDENEW